MNLMRLSSMKGAHVDVAWCRVQEIRVSRSFFARCGIPQISTPEFRGHPSVRCGEGSRGSAVVTGPECHGWDRFPGLFSVAQRTEKKMSVHYLYRFALVVIGIVSLTVAQAAVLTPVRGVVHDPHHRPVADATVTLHAADSDFVENEKTNTNGEFSFSSVPLGVYVITVADAGFDTAQQSITVASNTSPVLHFELEVAAVKQSVTVTSNASEANVDSVTPTTLIGREDIAHTPGADRTNSMAMITDFVPGAYMTHDMLHMRGGHELSWMIDGVNIPNTNIASNIAPQIDPKDIDYLEANRGSYNASLGDRTYGICDVVPRTCFERNRQGELVLALGNFYQTNDQLSLGNHSQKFAWYTSLNGNRSNYGLQPPIETPVHNASNGYGGFASLIYNHDQANQLRLVTQLRTDYYQIPYDPNADDWQNQLYD